MIRRMAIILTLCLALTLTACSSGVVTDGTDGGAVYALPSQVTEPEDAATAIAARGGYAISAAVLHSGDSQSWLDTLYYLQQPTTVNLDVRDMDADGSLNLSGLDVLYLDVSLAEADNGGAVVSAVMDFAQSGGAVFLPNGLADMFPDDFLGISERVKLEDFPQDVTYPEGVGDLGDIQDVIRDYHTLLPHFSDGGAIYGRDYGYAFRASTAVPLALAGEYALYAVNAWGDGAVFIANPLLPTTFITSSFTMESADEDASHFASTTASCTQLLLSRWAAYQAKRIYGFSLDRVFGYFGSPSMSWELHFEEITGFENNSMATFAELAEAANQVSSFTLIRSTYRWFQRCETMAYLLGTGSGFEMDYYESAYSSGTHIDSGGQWLVWGSLEDAGSYFVEYPEYRLRMVPAAVDYNGDGLCDFFCGTEDGSVLYYENLGFTGLDGRLRLAEAQPVTGVDVSAYSAPAIMDVDGDGVMDIISGGGDGTIRWFRGDGTLTFTSMGTLITTGFYGQAIPSVGDANGDGIDDLVVGSDQGILLIYFGDGEGNFSHDSMSALSLLCSDSELGDWLSPTLADYDGDGITDILVGTFDGYIALLRGDGDSFVFDGYVTVQEMNYKGNNNIKFGNYCSPLLLDLDGDGTDDLICGYQEYGMAVPIDSPYFSLMDELQSQVDYAQEHDYYMGLHFYTNDYASSERESYELSTQLDTLALYGIDTENIGANQHTWHTSSFSGSQSMRSLWEAGLLWQSGFGSSGDSAPAPQVAAENVIALPFFLMADGEQTILIQNNSVLPYRNEWTDISAKYGMPTCVYYHCDLIYNSTQEAESYIDLLSDFQWSHGYNFMKEDQLMYATAAAYNLSVTVSADEGGNITIAPGYISDDFPLFDADAQSCSGLRVSFSEGLAASFTPEARVWKETDDGYALGLDGEVTLRRDGEAARHILQVNVPASVDATDGGAVIEFIGDGMMQAVVDGAAETSDEGWRVETRNGDTVFTKFGDPDTLHITYLGTD